MGALGRFCLGLRKHCLRGPPRPQAPGLGVLRGLRLGAEGLGHLMFFVLFF